MHALRNTVVTLVVVALVLVAGRWMVDNQHDFDDRTTGSICRVSDRC